MRGDFVARQIIPSPVLFSFILFYFFPVNYAQGVATAATSEIDGMDDDPFANFSTERKAITPNSLRAFPFVRSPSDHDVSAYASIGGADGSGDDEPFSGGPPGTPLC